MNDILCALVKPSKYNPREPLPQTLAYMQYSLLFYVYERDGGRIGTLGLYLLGLRVTENIIHYERPCRTMHALLKGIKMLPQKFAFNKKNLL